MNGNVLTWYLKECLLKVKQNFICVGELLKKLATWDKSKSLSFQSVGPKNGQPRVTRFEYFVVPSKMKKC
jgi:hypothetical protein